MKRGPEGLSDYQLFSNKVTGLFILPVFLLLGILFILVVITLLKHCYCHLFLCLCLSRRKTGFGIREWKSRGVCMRKVWVLYSVGDRKGVTKWVREAYSAFAKQNSFSGLDACVYQKPCDYHLKRHLFLSLIQCIFLPNLNVLLSDWTLKSFFPQTV